MKKILLTMALICSMLVFVNGCGDKVTIMGSVPTDTTGLMQDVGVVKHLNASQRASVRYEIVTTMGRTLFVTDTTEIYMQASDFRGFDIASGSTLEPNRTIEYFFDMDDVNFAMGRAEYVLAKLYIYRYSYSDLPSITEE